MTERECSEGGHRGSSLDAQAGQCRPAPGAGENGPVFFPCVGTCASLLQLWLHLISTLTQRDSLNRNLTGCGVFGNCWLGNGGENLRLGRQTFSAPW